MKGERSPPSNFREWRFYVGIKRNFPWNKHFCGRCRRILAPVPAKHWWVAHRWTGKTNGLRHPRNPAPYDLQRLVLGGIRSLPCDWLGDCPLVAGQIFSGLLGGTGGN